MTEATFRTSEQLTKAMSDWLDSPLGSMVMQILAQNARVQTGKPLPACSEMLILTTAEYNRLLGQQQAIETLERLGKFQEAPRKEEGPKPLGQWSQEELQELVPPFVIPASSTTTI